MDEETRHPPASLWVALAMIPSAVIAGSISFTALLMTANLFLDGYPGRDLQLYLYVGICTLGLFAFSHMITRRAPWWSYPCMAILSGYINLACLFCVR